MDRSRAPPAFTRPLIHTISTPDLHSLLASSSNFPSLSTLLAPFASCPTQSPALNNVQVRTPPNHEPRLLDHFSIEFREKSLPVGWDSTSPTATSTPNAAAAPTTTASASLAMRRESSTGGIANMSQNQRDELFLDQLSSEIVSSNIVSPVGSPPVIKLDPSALHPKKRQYDLEGNVLDATATTSKEGTKQEWESKTLNDLTPWYKQFRHEVFKRREMVEYETWGWPVGCILALSTNHPDPLNALSLLWDLTSPTHLYSSNNTNSGSASVSNHEQEFVNPDILRYILIVHDMRTTSIESPDDPAAGPTKEQRQASQQAPSWDQVTKLEETVKRTYGVHTKVLGLYDHYEPMKTADELDKEKELGNKERTLEEELEKLWPSSDRESLRGNGPRLLGLGYLPNDEEQRILANQSNEPRGRIGSVANEQFNSSKKSLGGRLFSVGRKYFGSSSSSSNSPTTSGGNSRAGSPVTGGGQIGYNATRGYYSFQSQESQSRRLADLLFMLRDYKLASSVYGEVAKDFKNDRAWKHYSSATRMQGLCQLLLASSSTTSSQTSLAGSNTPDYLLQSSILAPSPSSPSMDFDLLRSTMMYHHYYSLLEGQPTTTDTSKLSSTALMRLVNLSIERTKAQNLAGGSGGGDEDELWTALICEQSALCHLAINNRINVNIDRSKETARGVGAKRMRERKFVLEMCLAGIRYEKSGLAASLYPLSPSSASSASITTTMVPSETFSSIKTYLHHSLARQAYNTSQPLDAIYHFLKLLPDESSQSLREGQGGEDSIDWLDDFALAWEQLGTTAAPAISKDGGDGREDTFQERAEWAIKRAGFELGIRLFDKKKIKISRRVVPAGVKQVDTKVEGLDTDDSTGWRRLENCIEVQKDKEEANGLGKMAKAKALREKLGANQALLGETFYLELPVRNPLEAFLSIGALTVQTDGEESPLEIEKSLDGDVIELAPLESRVIFIPMRGSICQTYQFTSISYRFHNLLPVLEPLSRPTSPFQAIKKTSPSSPSIQYPTVELLQPIPVLSVSMQELPNRLLHGQLASNVVKLKNTGQVPLGKLKTICSDPELVFFPSPNTPNEQQTPGGSESELKIDNVIRQNTPVQLMLKAADVLNPGEETEVEVIIRGDRVGEREIKWLFVFESPDGGLFSSRAVHTLEVSPSLEFRYATRPTSEERFPFVLDIEAFNSGIPAEDLVISSVSMLSPLWRISSLVSATVVQDQTKLEQVLSTPIPWQSASNLALAIDRVEANLKQCQDSIAWSMDQVEGLLQGKNIETRAPSDVDLSLSTYPSITFSEKATPVSLSMLSRPILESQSHERLESLTLGFPTVPQHLIPSLFPLFGATSSLLVIEFASASLNVSGHHFLRLPTLGASRNYLQGVLTTAELKAGGLYAESQRERTALIESLRRSELGRETDPAMVFVRVEEEAAQAHDFSQGPISVPVHFTIRNLSPTAAVECTLTLGTTTDSALVYTGLLTRRNKLEPLSMAKISTKVFISREGLYDLGGWKLEVKTEEGRIWHRDGEKRDMRIMGTRRVYQSAGAT